jgi:16S rRNA pseudouridine516 synthase
MKRLDKLIALNCNLSRKEARQLIKDGEVSVNGSCVLRAEELVDEQADTVSVKGYTFTAKDHIYIMLNKPRGVITATRDDNKETVIDLIPAPLRRRSLFPCGRLDRDTTGLLIITDDGALSHKIMSPSHHVRKTYIALLSYPLYDEDKERLEQGITLADGTVCLPAEVRAFEEDGAYYAEITIGEGKYHQVKRMFAAAGNHVESLRRVKIGSLVLDDSLGEGECRELTQEELGLIFEEKI